jgi:two-component system cell cycle response regulator
MVGDRDRILSVGFDGYVAKPISPETFVSELEKFLPAEKRAVVRDAAMPAGASALKTAARKSTTAGVRGTVVVVDDVPENLEFACSTLRPSGYAVFTATNVEDAVALMREKKPDVVLSDLNMEPQSGLDLLDRIKSDSKLRLVPVVIISSTATELEDELKCLERGAAHFIRRPIEPEMLLAEIEKILSKSAASAA